MPATKKAPPAAKRETGRHAKKVTKPAKASKPAPAPEKPKRRRGGGTPPPPPLGNQRAKGNKGGRGQESLYQPHYAKSVRRMVELGATKVEIAEMLGVSFQSIQRWEVAHPEFAESMDAYLVHATKNVARKLWERATGYSHPAVKIMQDKGVPVIVPYVEHVPPDVNAQKFWLQNRARKEWDQGDEGDGRRVVVNLHLAGKPK